MAAAMASRRPGTPSVCSTAETWWSTVRTESTSRAAISALVAVGEHAQDLDLPVGEPGRVCAPHARGGGAGAEFVEAGEGGQARAVVALGQLQRRGVRAAERLPRRGGRPPVAADARRQLVRTAGERLDRLAEAPRPPSQLAALAFRTGIGRALVQRRDGRAGGGGPVEQPRLLDLGQQRGHQLVFTADGTTASCSSASRVSGVRRCTRASTASTTVAGTSCAAVASTRRRRTGCPR